MDQTFTGTGVYSPGTSHAALDQFVVLSANIFRGVFQGGQNEWACQAASLALQAIRSGCEGVVNLAGKEMQKLELDTAVVTIPMPLFVQIEDVGWWQGSDGSSKHQPYRSGFGRDHCLDDYRALASLARRLSMRIALGMVIGEWDRSDYLKNVPGATWMGSRWDNSTNRGPWLDEAAGFLNDHAEVLDIALHGLCHEFWEDGRLQRTEFHDKNGRVRSKDILRRHLDAFFHILEENGIKGQPRLFIPPALHHSFGDGPDSIQALLNQYGIDYVTAGFAKARQYSPPLHPLVTWEEGVVLLDRGEAPVDWHVSAAPVPQVEKISGPILPLHWTNILHRQAARNKEVVERWSEMLCQRGEQMDCLLSADLDACARQTAAWSFARLKKRKGGVVIDLRDMPDVDGLTGSFSLKIKQNTKNCWQCEGASIWKLQIRGQVMVLELAPHRFTGEIRLTPQLV